MEQLLLIVYVLVCVGMIGLILLQQGKGADMGAAFGSGSSQTMFGPAGGGNLLTRSTAILATGFFVISLGLAVLAKERAEEARNAAIPIPAMVESASDELPGVEAAPSEIPMIDSVVTDSSAVDDEVPSIEEPMAETGEAGGDDLPEPYEPATTQEIDP